MSNPRPRSADDKPLLSPGPHSRGSRVEHVDAWRTMLRDSVLELDVTPVAREDRPDYTGWVHVMDIGHVNVVDVGSDPVRVARTRRLIRRNPDDVYHLSVAQRPSWSAAGGHHTQLRTGDAVLVDGVDPWAVGTADSFGHFVVVNVPRTLLRRDLRVEPAMLGQVIPAENPVLRALMRVVAEVARGASTLPSDSLFELGHSVNELLVSTLRVEEHGHRSPADSRSPRNVLFLQMREFVLDHLSDPDLSITMLADAFRVSRRTVEMAFQQADLSPARFIRETRLAAARRMLADPRQRHRSIAAIGRSVGIEHPATFARVFRSHYDLTPREYRQANSAGKPSNPLSPPAEPSPEPLAK